MATKKISELPLVNRVSGSQVAGGSVLPIVIGGGIQGTTNQISVEDFSIFVNAYNAHTGSAGNVFTGPQTINNNVIINGRLTVNEVVAQYETASILFSTGSTKLGDQLTDKHELTGSIGVTGSFNINGSAILNGQSLNNAFDRIHQTTHSLQLATASLQFHSASVNAQLLAIQQTTQSLHVATASLQFHSASVNAQLQRLQQTTQSLQVATASLQAFSSSVNEQLERVYQTTQSLHVATASLEFHSASVDAQLLAIQQTTQSLHVATASLNEFSASTNAHIVGISDFTSSQLAVNLGNAIYTASVDSHIVGISTYTSSVRDTLARVHQTTQSLQVATASIQIQTASLLAFTASQDGRNFVLSQVTGSLIGITNGLMAFTAALDNTYATDAQLYQLYQATRSIELHSGSMIGVTNGLMAYTASNTNLNAGLRGEVDGIESYTASLKGQAIVSSSTQITNYYKFAETASVNTFYGDQTITGSLAINDSATNFLIEGNGFGQTYFTAGGAMVLNPGFGGIEMVGSYRTFKATDITADGFVSGEIRATNNVVSSSTQIQNYDVFALNSNLYNGTGSIKAEIAGIEAYTASLKGAAIVSSSQQIKNYIEFVNNSVTSSMNVNSASIAYKATNVVGSANRILFNNATDTTTTSANLEWNGSTLAVNGNISFGYSQTLQSSLDPTNNISLHDGTFGEIRIRNGGTNRITIYRTTDTIQLSGSLLVNPNNASAKHEITGGLDVSGGITGSFKGNLNGTANLASNASQIVVLRDNTDTTLYPVFSSNIASDAYATLRGHTSGTLYYNGLTQQLNVGGGGLVVSGSLNVSGSTTIIGTPQITGSLLVTGSITITSGSITMPHRPAFRVVGDGGAITTPYIISGSRVTVDYNQGNHYNPANGQFTAPIAGLYQVNLVARTNSNSAPGISQVIVDKIKASDSSIVTQIMVEWAANTTSNHMGGSTITKMEVGDKLYAWVGAGTISFDGNDNFSVAYIG